MKNLLTACLPAVALLALGGCAGTSALTSTEDDGVYYSSKDRTTAVMNTAPIAQSTGTPDEAANPDYNGNTSGTTARQNSGSDQYYDNTYTYMRGVPSYSSATYYAPGVSYYTPYSPYTSLSMGYGYGWGGGACGYSPYAYGGYDPFYSSFYSPWGYSPYGYGSGLSISFGFGRSWGYGGYGYGYNPWGYSPYGYGYGGGFYDPYYYNSRFYGGYYGSRGYYGNNYYGGSYNNNGSYGNSDRGTGRTYGHRTDRASEGRRDAGAGGVNPGSTGPTGVAGGGRVRSEMVAPSGNVPQSMPNGLAETSRGRSNGMTSKPDAVVDQSAGSYNNRPRQLDAATQSQYRDMNPATATPGSQPMQDQAATRGDNRGRWRTADAQPQSMPGQMQPAASQPQEGRRRGGFFQNVFGEPINSGNQGQATDASQPRQRGYDQSRQQTYSQPQRTYDQPQRTYEQPQRTYEQPQRSYSQPSYSAPSYGGGGGNGGGGGGGGGGRGRSN